jgi:hypothetical protein
MIYGKEELTKAYNSGSHCLIGVYVKENWCVLGVQTLQVFFFKSLIKFVIAHVKM